MVKVDPPKIPVTGPTPQPSRMPADLVNKGTTKKAVLNSKPLAKVKTSAQKKG